MEKNPTQITTRLVNTPELEKAYEAILLQVFSEIGYNSEEILAEKAEAETWRFLVEFQGKIVGAGRLVKTGDVYNMQRSAILKEYRLHGLHEQFSKFGVEYVKKIKKPHETLETYVHVFTRKTAERSGLLVDLSKPVRLNASPLIFYRATLPPSQNR